MSKISELQKMLEEKRAKKLKGYELINKDGSTTLITEENYVHYLSKRGDKNV